MGGIRSPGNRGTVKADTSARGRRKAAIPVYCTVTPLPDGACLLTPLRPVLSDETDSWLRVGKAAALLGLDRRKIYPLLGDLLHYRRPLKALHLVSLESIKRLKAASQAKDFWHSPELQRPVRAWVRQQMGKAIAPRLQPDES
jgi:hypothetical protein